MAVEDVQVKSCQQEIVKLDLQVKAVTQDVRQCLGPMDKLQELNQDARLKMQTLKKRIEELESLAREQDKETDKIALLKEAEHNRKQMANTQMALRKANFMCQKNIEKREKEQLLDPTAELRKRPISNKEQLARTSSEVTENLMSLSRMMAGTVKQSEATMGTLVTSSSKVSETNDEMRSMTGHIQNSRKLLTKYGRRECTDKLLIFLAMVFFFATVLYIVKKRVWSSAEMPVETHGGGPEMETV